MYNIGIVKTQTGPWRPPYDVFPDHIHEDARVVGERWAGIEKEIGAVSQ